MDSTTPTASDIPEQEPRDPLATLAATGILDEDTDEVIVGQPICPQCSGRLEVSRIYKGRDVYRVDEIRLTESADGTWVADVVMDHEARSDEYLDVYDTQVQCANYYGNCDFVITPEATGLVTWE